jgi:hypothetical protein
LEIKETDDLLRIFSFVEQMLGKKKANSLIMSWLFVLIVGDYYTKFEPFTREKKVARVDYLVVSA